MSETKPLDEFELRALNAATKIFGDFTIDAGKRSTKLSLADQIAFMEISQPILNKLVRSAYSLGLADGMRSETFK